MQKFIALILLSTILYPFKCFATCVGLNCSCSISANNLAFGAYAPISGGSQVDGSATLTVTCGALVLGGLIAYDIDLSTGSSGSFSSRNMSNGSHNLTYNLYTDSNRTTIWGDGTSSTSIVSDSYTLSLVSTNRDYTIYGRIDASQNVSAGNYSDTITATVTF